MKTILITGGTRGIGEGLAKYYLANGNRVVIVSRSQGKLANAIYLQADLSLVSENYRVGQIIKEKYGEIDGLILCAVEQAYRKNLWMTKEKFEFTFALQYLSRYILSHKIAVNDFILNIATPGMGGTINFEDLQGLEKFSSLRANVNGNRLNDLLGVSFSNSGVKYILYNPMSVRTAGARSVFVNPMMKLILKIWHRLNGRDVETVVKNIVTVVSKTSKNQFIAYKVLKPVNLGMKTFNVDRAAKLEQETQKLLNNING